MYSPLPGSGVEDRHAHPSSERNGGVTVTPQLARKFKATSDRYCRAGYGNFKMTVVVE
jgi:hypothetical protein